MVVGLFWCCEERSVLEVKFMKKERQICRRDGSICCEESFVLEIKFVKKSDKFVGVDPRATNLSDFFCRSCS